MEQTEKSRQFVYLNLFFELPEKSEWPFDFCSKEWIEHIIQTEMNKPYSRYYKKRNIMTELLRSHKDLKEKQKRKERMQRLQDYRKHYSYDGDGHDYDIQKPLGDMELQWCKDAHPKTQIKEL